MIINDDHETYKMNLCNEMFKINMNHEMVMHEALLCFVCLPYA
jgi:hypothetical protein